MRSVSRSFDIEVRNRVRMRFTAEKQARYQVHREPRVAADLHLLRRETSWRMVEHFQDPATCRTLDRQKKRQSEKRDRERQQEGKTRFGIHQRENKKKDTEKNPHPKKKDKENREKKCRFPLVHCKIIKYK